MRGLVWERLFWTGPVLLGVSVLVFLLMALIPGDPALALLGPYATEANLDRLRAQMALDAPLWTRYFTWIGQVLQGDFGYAYSVDRPVAEELWERGRATLLLASAGYLVCLLLGVGAGVFAAARQYTWIDRSLSVVSMVGISTPAFWLGLLFVMVFSIHLQWLPSGGIQTFGEDPSAGALLRHLALPALTLGLVAAALVARFVRTQMLEVLRLDFVRTARAKGAGEGRILWCHAVRAGIVPVLPVLGLQAGYVLGGAVYVETVFQWPGLGRMLVEAVTQRDLLLVQGGVLLVATAYVLVNLAADVLQAVLDPRLQK